MEPRFTSLTTLTKALFLPSYLNLRQGKTLSGWENGAKSDPEIHGREDGGIMQMILVV
jgi:hypothetical protein